MRTLSIAILFATLCVFLPACDGGSEAKDGQSAATSSSGSATGTSSTTAPKTGEGKAESKPNGSAEEPDPSTAEGTMSLFIESLSEGAFDLAMEEYADPASPGYEDLEQAFESVQKSESNPNLPASLRDGLLASMTAQFKSLKWEKVVEEGDRARFQLSFPSGKVELLDVTKIDKRWYVVVPDKFVTNNFTPTGLGGLGG